MPSFLRITMLVLGGGVLFTSAVSVLAADRMRPIASIVAIVNGAPLSGYDLEQYIRLNLATSSLPYNEENVERMRDGSLDRLVEDRIKLQEAGRLGIRAGQRQIESAIARMVAQSGLEQDQFADYLDVNGISPNTLRQRISADIVWNEIIRRRIAPRVLVRQQEVDRMYQRQNADPDESRYLLSELFIRAGEGETAEKYNLVEQLRLQLMSGDAPFALAAGQFSDSPSRLSGGDIGWIAKSALRDEWRSAVLKLAPRGVSRPIPTPDGYYLLFLRDRQLVGDDASEHQQVRLLTLRFPAARTEAESGSMGASLEGNFLNCEQSLDWARGEGGEFEDFGFLSAADLSGEIRGLLGGAERGDVLRSNITTRGAEILFLCDKRSEERPGVSRNQIEYNLINQRAGLQAVEYLRDLRRNAEIEMRDSGSRL